MTLLDTSWEKDALCSQAEKFDPAPEFYNKEQVAYNKSVCHLCPVRLECYAYALLNHEDETFLAGMFYKQRQMVSAILNIPFGVSQSALVDILRSKLS